MSSIVKIIGNEEPIWTYDSNTNTLTLNAQEIFNPNNEGTSISLLGEQITSSNAAVKVIYTTTDKNGLGAGIYPFIQITDGTDLYIGVQAGNDNNGGTGKSGNYNVGIGYKALYSNTTGGRNTAVGWKALYSNTYGGSNTAVGWKALINNTTGTGNTAVGTGALNNNTTGNNNIAIGNNSFISNTTGNYNTAIGVGSLEYFNDTTGADDYNTAIGYQAGVNYTGSERNNILINNEGVAGESNVIKIGTGIQLGASTQTTTNGTTAGSFVASMPFQSASYKKVIVYLNGYENDTTTAQTYTFPTAFSETPAITLNSASVPGVSVSTTALSLVPDTTTAYTGWIIIEGY